jgi:hypothetical protein
LDEAMPATRDVPDVAGAFRSLVAETRHRVEPKGQKVVTVRGAMRVIIAANNDSALPMVGAYSRDDIEAVAARIRWIGCDPAAAGYLRDLGGRKFTLAWLDGLAFARHVRWLELHREVEVGDRFLVPGRMRTYHETLALTSDRLRVLHAVGSAVLSGTAGMRKAGVRVVAQGLNGVSTGSEPPAVSVDVSLLRARWVGLTGDTKSPTVGTVVESLRALSGVIEAGRGARVYAVPSKYLLLAADRMGLPRWEIARVLKASTTEKHR